MGVEKLQCWNCGYDLIGLEVDDLCPECGTEAPGKPPVGVDQTKAIVTLLFGFGSLVVLIACPASLAVFGYDGPLAASITLPIVIALVVMTFVYANLAERPYRRAGIRVVQTPLVSYGLFFAMLTFVIGAVIFGLLGLGR